jgi:hypothetical protein
MRYQTFYVKKVRAFYHDGGQGNVQHITGELMRLRFVFCKFLFRGLTEASARRTRSSLSVPSRSLSKRTQGDGQRRERDVALVK